MSLTVNYSILFSSRRQHTRLQGDWSSDVCSSDLSAEQFSNITLEFTLDRDIETVAQDVRDKVSRVRDRLPDDKIGRASCRERVESTDDALAMERKIDDNTVIINHSIIITEQIN